MATPTLSPAAQALHARAAGLEAAGDLAGALELYERALALAPQSGDLLADLAGLAERLDMTPVAAALWARLRTLEPGRLEALDGEVRALTVLGRFAEAIDILRPAIEADPADARLWNSLGVVLIAQGDSEGALTFFEESLRLDERQAKALYNRGGAHLDLGRLETARDDFAAARRLAERPADGAMIDLAQALLRLSAGDIGAGWDAYEARLSPDRADPVTFDLPGATWTPEAALEGRSLLVMAEQGLGDEIMFANLLPEVLSAAGRVSIAAEPRLVALFQRSFPGAHVSAHATERIAGRLRRTAPGVDGAVDLWAPMASLARRFRRDLAAFPSRRAYLTADPERVAHWRDWLGSGAPAVGLSWRSGKLGGERRRQYPALDCWTPLLATPGVRFVNLQYGDCADELAALQAIGGVALAQPPGIDLRADIDDLAALCVALDTVVSVPNATAALAGACGASLSLIAPPVAWTQLGTDSYPWYPGARCFVAPAMGAWTEPILAAARALGARARD